MKKLLPIILIALYASCVPARKAPYGCPKGVTSADNLPAYFIKSDSFSLRIDTSLVRRWVAITPDSALRTGIAINQTRYVVPASEPKPNSKPDTIPEWMHISMRPKGFVIAQMALSVRDGGYCIAHLDCNGKAFPVHYKVGWCQGKEQLLTRLVEEREGRP